MINLKNLDHLVLTVKDIPKTVEFYTQILGMEEVNFGEGRKALRFGKQKINLHEIENEIGLKANSPVSGSADLCFITEIPLEKVVGHLKNNNVQILDKFVERTGAVGKIISVYFRDPDLNLIEVSNYLER